jgi:hypothetical protein
MRYFMPHHSISATSCRTPTSCKDLQTPDGAGRIEKRNIGMIEERRFELCAR